MTDRECLWNTLLVADNRHEIVSHLDGASAAMLGQTCRAEHEEFLAQKDPWTFPGVYTVHLATRLGYEGLQQYCFIQYPYHKEHKKDCLHYALGGRGEAVCNLLRKQWEVSLNINLPLSGAPRMSWTVYTTFQETMQLTDQKCFGTMLCCEPEFHDRHVLCDVLKRAFRIGFSDYMFKLALTDGTPELCEYIQTCYPVALEQVFNVEDQLYYFVREIIEAANTDGLLFLRRKWPTRMNEFFADSPYWQRHSRIAIHTTLCSFRRFPTYERNVIPMVRLLLSLGCTWLESDLTDWLRTMASRCAWDKEQLRQLRDLGMPMILPPEEGFFKDYKENPYWKWIKKELMPEK